MDFFGVGPLELIFIVVLALIVFGPRKLPELGRQVGRTIYQFRKATADLSQEFVREFQDVNEAVQEFRSDVTGLGSEVSGLGKELTLDLNDASAPAPRRIGPPKAGQGSTTPPLSVLERPLDLGPFAAASPERFQAFAMPQVDHAGGLLRPPADIAPLLTLDPASDEAGEAAGGDASEKGVA